MGRDGHLLMNFIRIGAAISNTYVSWSLFLSSYSPLLLIFALRLSEKKPDIAFWLVVLGAIFALNLLFILNTRVGARDYSIVRAESGAAEVAAYIATYLLPFLVVGDTGPRDLFAYGILVLTVGFVMTSGRALHVNPLLAMMGYKLFTITTVDKVRFFLLSREHPEAGETIRTIQLWGGVLIQQSEKAND